VAVFLDQKLQEEGSSPGTQGTTGHTAASKILGVTPHPSPHTHTHTKQSIGGRKRIKEGGEKARARHKGPCVIGTE
jgi:hypothetical protein